MPVSDVSRSFAGPATGYLMALVGVLLGVFVAAAAQRWLGLTDLSLVFILCVLLVATRTSTGPALLAAVLSFLAYNFFFIDPRYTLYIRAPGGIATVLLFLGAALVSGRLASRLAMQVQALRSANRHALARYQLGQRLATSRSVDDIVEAATDVFGQALDATIWVRTDIRAQPRPGARPGSAVIEHGWWFLPLSTAQGSLGSLGLKLDSGGGRPDPGESMLICALVDDIAQALLRIRLADALHAERIGSEAERLRNALLASVSHDLRTPLAAIIGAASSLDAYGDAMDAEDRRALLDTVLGEGERLDCYIQNLLDMTRIGHGPLALERDWIGVDELIGSAIRRTHRYRPGVELAVSLEASLAPIRVHAALVEQALFNVIDNAAKFSPLHAPVSINAGRVDGGLRIDVRDAGPGIPEEERERVFEMFYSVGRGDQGHEGTGLGLAICRGMIEAHGGSVVVLPGPESCGTTVRIILPGDALAARS